MKFEQLHTCNVLSVFYISEEWGAGGNGSSERCANITRQHWGNGNVASLGRCSLCRNKTVIKHEDRV